MTARGRTAWRGWAAALLLLLAAAGGFALLRGGEAPPEPAAPDAAQPNVDPPGVPQPDPLLDRAALIDAAADAASAYASGAGLGDVHAQLAGRRFRMNLPFGCAGPMEPERAIANGWRVDDEGRTLRIGLTRRNWTLEDRSLNGFLIDLPWIRTPVCPAQPASETADPAGGEALPVVERETLALVEEVDPEARGGRPQRAYRADVRVTAAEAPVAGAGLRLRIDGRLSGSGLPPVLCRHEGTGLRPMCFLVARFESVAVTSASGERVFAEWRD